MMGALGLTHGLFALGTHTYGAGYSSASGGVSDWSGPQSTGLRLVHNPPKSPTKPTKEMGSQAFTVSGTLICTAAVAQTFINDLRTGTVKRKVSWLEDDSTEVYMWAYSGDVTANDPINPWGEAATTPARYKSVGFSITSIDSRLYKAADDSILWGG
jgi:hypothetical protein